MEGSGRWDEGVETGDITANLPSDNRSFQTFIQAGHELLCRLPKVVLASRECSSVGIYHLEKPEGFQAREFYHRFQYSPQGLVGPGVGYCTQHR